MAAHGWMINLSGSAMPVYTVGSSGPTTPQLGTLTKNECFVDGNISFNPWEGEGQPVIFLNSSHEWKFGLLDEYSGEMADFSNYASNGTSWVAVNTLERKVQYATKAYYSNGNFLCDLPVGSRVWLTSNCTAGSSHSNYVAVTRVKTDTIDHTFSGNGFVDLTYNNRWVNVGSILLRKV